VRCAVFPPSLATFPDACTSLVFRALALLHLERRAESEAAYRLAIAAQPDTLLAWQGLEKLYAQTRAWQQLAECQRRQMDLLRER
jgi:superkiller protein 3